MANQPLANFRICVFHVVCSRQPRCLEHMTRRGVLEAPDQPVTGKWQRRGEPCRGQLSTQTPVRANHTLQQVRGEICQTCWLFGSRAMPFQLLAHGRHAQLMMQRLRFVGCFPVCAAGLRSLRWLCRALHFSLSGMPFPKAKPRKCPRCMKAVLKEHCRTRRQWCHRICNKCWPRHLKEARAARASNLDLGRTSKVVPAYVLPCNALHSTPRLQQCGGA